jgi:putative tryptophan/tyrosine transport system substrate-binding protein
VFGSEFVAIHRKTLAALALRHQLPAIYQAGAYVAVGGLMSYGPDFREHSRLLAETLDKILRGAKAGEIPIQQPTKFELVINLKTAKASG